MVNHAVGLGFSQAYYDVLQGYFQQYLPDKTIWAYGSRVTGTAHARSDLDCVVFGALSGDVFALQEALTESLLPFEVQLHRWEDLPTEFHEAILQCYRVLQ
ncbi:MAG: nucleotidyltransferase family protein [Vampirovibrionales bacterium]